MAKRDYYEILGLSKGVSQDDIKKAYRKLAIQYHPDKNPGDKNAEERFKEATEAYEILSDDSRRQTYDQFGFAGLEGMGAGGSGGAHDFSAVFRDFGDIFGDFNFFDSFFGGSSGGRQTRSSASRGADIRYDLRISFTDAAFGKKENIEYDRRVQCSDCKGMGYEPGTGRQTCKNCGGTGQVRRSSGFFSIASPCPACNGSGTIIENPCESCHGRGAIKKHTKLKVTIPPGIESGKRISIPGKGDAGKNGGPAGDFYVFITVRPHRYFERNGADLYCVIPVDIVQAALGTEITVPNLEEKKIKLKIPSGTQNGKMFRVKNEGLPHLQNPQYRGDLYIKIQVRTPVRLKPQSRNLLREFGRLEGMEESPKPVPLKDL